MFVGLMPEMQNAECKVQNVLGLSLRGGLQGRRGNPLWRRYGASMLKNDGGCGKIGSF